VCVVVLRVETRACVAFDRARGVICALRIDALRWRTDGVLTTYCVTRADNFSVTATLKAYFDQVARAGVTFKYNDQGVPEGLLTNKKAYVVVSSGGVPMNAPGMDFLTPHVKTFLGLLGISDVTFIDATGQMKREDANESATAVINAIDIDAMLA
jgi:hypothetical protein